MSAPIRALEAKFVKVGTVYVPESYWPFFAQLLQVHVASPTTPASGTVTGDQNEIGVTDAPMPPVPLPSPAFPSPPTEPERDAAPSTAPGNAPVEKYDVEGGTIGAGAASGTEDAAALPAEGGPPTLPPKSAWARAWACRARRRRARRGPLNAPSINTAGGSIEQDAQAAAADCAAPDDEQDDGEGNHGADDGPVHDGAEDDAAEDDGDDGGDDDGGDDERGDDDGRDDGGLDESPAEELVDVQVELPDDGITIDPEIAALLPRESPEENATLTNQLLHEGCRDPVVVWQHGPCQVLLDGHTRLAICRVHKIAFKRKTLELPDRLAAITWVVNNQLGRRNITAKGQAYLRGKLYNAHKRQGARTDLTSGHSDQRLTLAERMADQYGVSEKTIRREADFAEELDQLAATYGVPLRDAVLAADDPMSRAEVARAVRLDAPMRDRILARIGQREAALDVIRETLGKRAVKGPQARAAEAEDAAGQVDAVTPSGTQQEDPPSSAPTRPGLDPALDADRHTIEGDTIDGAVDALEARVHELKKGELSPLHAQRLVERLSEIQRDLVARATTARSEVPGAPPSVPKEAASSRQNTSTPGHRLAARLSPGLVRLPAVDHLHQAVEQTGGPLPRDGGARSPPRPPEP